jgi:hypothetical protein
MFKIAYLNSSQDYAFLRTERKNVIEVFNMIEAAGGTVITVYDYSNRIQLYRCLNYEFYRGQLLSYLRSSLSAVSHLTLA